MYYEAIYTQYGPVCQTKMFTNSANLIFVKYTAYTVVTVTVSRYRYLSLVSYIICTVENSILWELDCG